jgi:hypothetical protein
MANAKYYLLEPVKQVRQKLLRVHLCGDDVFVVTIDSG